MINLKINNISLKVAENTSVLKAAEQLGIKIPTMCFLAGYGNHPSCMVCLVQDAKTGKMHPSCALPSAEGMEMLTDTDEVKNARKEALELLLSDHVGDCVAPCEIACPAGMDIPKMNRLIANNQFNEALQVVKEDIALPYILGYICPAPCEKVCRRKQVDEAVSICSLKKFVAAEDLAKDNSYLPNKEKNSGKKVAIIGTGPAGLAAAFYLQKAGHNTVLFDKNEKAGGALVYEDLRESLPIEAVESELELIKQMGATFKLNEKIDQKKFNKLKHEFDAIVLATGNFDEANTLGFEKAKFGITVNRDTYETNEVGVFACGNIIRSRKMAVTSVGQGKSAALSVDLFLKGEAILKKHRKFNSKFGKLFESEIEEYKKETITDGRVHLEKGKLDDFTKEQAVLEAQRCMHCDCRKIDNCKLRDLSDEYKAKQSRFMFGERKLLKKQFTHEIIVYESEKCIRCNLCVDITMKNGELKGLTTVNRGFQVEIQVPFGDSINEALTKTAIQCAKACPTGAISLK